MAEVETRHQQAAWYRRLPFGCAVLVAVAVGGWFHLEWNAVGGATPEAAATHFIRGSVEAYLPGVKADDIRWVITASDATGDAAKRVELVGYIGSKRIASGAFQRFMRFGWQLLYVGLDEDA